MQAKSALRISWLSSEGIADSASSERSVTHQLKWAVPLSFQNMVNLFILTLLLFYSVALLIYRSVVILIVILIVLLIKYALFLHKFTDLKLYEL